MRPSLHPQRMFDYWQATITHLVQWHGQLAYLHSAYELKRINA